MFGFFQFEIESCCLSLLMFVVATTMSMVLFWGGFTVCCAFQLYKEKKKAKLTVKEENSPLKEEIFLCCIGSYMQIIF